MTPERIAGLGDDVSLVARALLRYRLLLPAAAISKSLRVRTLVRRSLAELFERVDVLAWPTVAAPAPPLENPTVNLPSGAYPADYANPRQAGIANLAGVPAISVPVGPQLRGAADRAPAARRLGPRRAAAGRRGGAGASQRAPVG